MNFSCCCIHIILDSFPFNLSTLIATASLCEIVGLLGQALWLNYKYLSSPSGPPWPLCVMVCQIRARISVFYGFVSVRQAPVYTERASMFLKWFLEAGL